MSVVPIVKIHFFVKVYWVEALNHEIRITELNFSKIWRHWSQFIKLFCSNQRYTLDCWTISNFFNMNFSYLKSSNNDSEVKCKLVCVWFFPLLVHNQLRMKFKLCFLVRCRDNVSWVHSDRDYFFSNIGCRVKKNHIIRTINAIRYVQNDLRVIHWSFNIF